MTKVRYILSTGKVVNTYKEAEASGVAYRKEYVEGWKDITEPEHYDPGAVIREQLYALDEALKNLF